MTGMFDRGFERAAELLPDEEPVQIPEPEYKKSKVLRDINLRILHKA